MSNTETEGTPEQEAAPVAEEGTEQGIEENDDEVVDPETEEQ